MYNETGITGICGLWAGKGEHILNILVTLNSNYIKPLKVMLYSLFTNNKGEEFSIYLMHSSLTKDELDDLNRYMDSHRQKLIVININDYHFKNAPVLFHYTKEMYYRLLAHKFLPQSLDKILYLDPDILVINQVGELYNTDIGGYLYAAAYHDLIAIKGINRLRLIPYDIDAYYNSGVLLMNLELHRQQVDEQSIYDFVENNRSKLIMPDQDIINAMYAKKIKSLDEKLYNYDVRYYNYNKIKTDGMYDMEHIMMNTVILHFCGKKKPWRKGYNGRFHSLYKHYENQALNRERT